MTKSYTVAPATIRKVWAQLTKTPTATVAELMRTTGLCRQTVQRSIDRLVELQYVERTPGGVHARRIVVAFAVMSPPHWDQPARAT